LFDVALTVVVPLKLLRTTEIVPEPFCTTVSGLGVAWTEHGCVGLGDEPGVAVGVGVGVGLLPCWGVGVGVDVGVESGVAVGFGFGVAFGSGDGLIVGEAFGDELVESAGFGVASAITSPETFVLYVAGGIDAS
jgi:hypothetical protein